MQSKWRPIAPFYALWLLAGCTAVAVVTHETSTEPVDSPSGAYKWDNAHSSLLFFVRHLKYADFTGRFNAVTGTLEFDSQAPQNSRLSMTIDAASIDTGNETVDALLRDEAMFDAANHSAITFESTTIQRTGPNTGRVAGDLTVRGRARPVVLDVTFNGGAPNPIEPVYTLGFSATGTLERSQFGLGAWIPAVADEVELRVEAEFKRPH